MNHVHYVQRHGGVPVFGSEIIVHLNPDGEFSTVNGRALEMQDSKVATVPGLSADAASVVARNFAMKRSEYMNEALESLGAPRLCIYNEGFVNNSAKSTSHLVWEVALAGGHHAGGSFFIEADKDARLIKYMSGIHELNRKVFDCGDPFGDTTCYLNTFSSQYNYFFGRGESSPVRGPNPVPGPIFGSTDVDTLHGYVPIIESYYLSKFGRNGGNDRGGIGDGTNIPFTETRIFANRPVDHPSGALYNANGSLGFNHGAVCDDMFGHEYAHGVALHKSYNLDGSSHSLSNEGESGAINESHSDLFGEAFEYYRTGGADWVVGTGGSLYRVRSLADPPSGVHWIEYNYPYPDRYHHPDFYHGDLSWDQGGVHQNAGVLNKAAYLTAVGGTFNGRTIAGIGLAKVEQIWYRALSTYYADSETFNGAYFALRQAAADLYPAADVDELTKALQAVEMDQPPLPAPPFVITTVTRPAPAFSAAVTWNSHAGQHYGVQYSTDLATWTELNASVPAQGERTTYTDTVVAPTASALFYRVERK